MTDTIPQPKFLPGQTVYIIENKGQFYEKCPACCGDKILRVLLGDDSIVEVACTGCENGYNGSTGYISLYSIECIVKEVIVRKVKSYYDNDGYSYEGDFGLYLSDHNAYATYEEAKIAADKRTQEQIQTNYATTKMKKDSVKGVGWTVRYHKHQIKELNKKLECHNSKIKEIASGDKK